MSKLTIELVRHERRDEQGNKLSAGNGDIYITPMEEKRRGRWLKANEHPDWSDGNKLAKILPEELPGYHVTIDIRAKKVVVFDPLYNSPKADEMAKRFESGGKTFPRLERPKTFDNLAPEQLWAWLKWAYRTHQAGHCEIKEGEFPKGVAERVNQERLWDAGADPHTGARKWEPEPDLKLAAAAA